MAYARSGLSGCSLTASIWGKLSATYLTVLQPFQQYGGAYSFRGLAESHLIPLSSLYGGQGSFPGSAPPNDTGSSEHVRGLSLVILVW